jgi:hypothetical protein
MKSPSIVAILEEYPGSFLILKEVKPNKYLSALQTVYVFVQKAFYVRMAA